MGVWSSDGIELWVTDEAYAKNGGNDLTKETE